MTPEKPPKDALDHGYRPSTLGKRKCRSCRYSDDRTEGNDKILCRMFNFLAATRGTCDEWEQE